MEAYFLSDIHLRGMEGPDAATLTRFLEEIASRPTATHLFLLGDIFDLWIDGHRTFVRRFAPIVDRLRRLASGEVDVHYFEGNHDFYLRGFWQDEIGIRVHDGARTLSLGGLRLRLEHGDQLNPADRGYRLLRRFLRAPPVRGLVSRLPGPFLDLLGTAASQTSRLYTDRSKEISREEIRRLVRRHTEAAQAEAPFDVIVIGHIHLRDDFTFEYEGRRIRAVNLGSWEQGPCTFRITETGGDFVALGEE